MAPLGQLDERVYRLDIRDFSAGLVNSVADINIPIGGGDILYNARLDETSGALKKRENRAKYNTTSLGANPIMGGQRIYIGSNAYNLFVYDTTLYVGDDSGGTPTILDTVTANLRYNWVTYKDFTYIFNGTDSNIRTDGVNSKSAGCAIPTNTPAATEGAAGNLAAGDYGYKITFMYDAYQESEPQSATVEATIGASKKCELTKLPIVPADSYDKHYLNFEGADAATTHFCAISDESITFNGTAQLDTAQFKFGTSSLLLDGNSDYVNIPKDEFAFADSAWTISMYIRINTDQDSVLLGIYKDANNYMFFKYDSTNSKLHFKWVGASSTEADYEVTWNPSTATWYHLELARNGSTMYLFIDGTSQALTETTAISTTSLTDLDTAASVGEHNSSDYFDGWIDELRISVGVARHTASFTELTESYPSMLDITSRKIYRTEADGSTYYYLAAVSDNYTTTYSDNTADAGLDTATTVPDDQTLPVTCKYAVLHKDRIFIAGNSTNKSRVYYSDITSGTSYPDVFPDDNYIDVAEDDGDEITGLEVDPTGNLCVVKRNSIRKIFTGGAPVTWTVSDPFTTEGCDSPYTISDSPYGIIYLSRAGENEHEIRLFDGQHSKLLSDKVSKEVNKILRSRVEECEGHFHGDKYYLCFTDETSGFSHNDRVLIYDFVKQNYVIDIKDVNCFWTLYGSDDRGELYTGDSQAGQVYREDAASFDIIHSTKSDLDEGTFTQCESGGTEASPTVVISSGAGLTGQVGNTKVSDLTADPGELVSVYATYGDKETVSPSGHLVSDVIEINAENLSTMYWSEALGTNGQMTGWVRLGASSSACQATSWEGPYWDASGSDISAVSGNTFLQYRIILYTDDVTTLTTPELNADDGYAVKITADFGTAAESAIPFEWRSGQIDCGHPRVVKKFRGVRLEYDSNSTGTLTCYYSLDRGSESSFSIDLSTNPSKYTSNFSSGKLGELIRLRLYQNDTNPLTVKRITLLYTLKPVRWS